MAEDHGTAIATLQNEVEALRGEIAELSSSTKALVEAWNTATGVVKFVKWLSTFIAAVGAVYLFFAHGFTGKSGG